MSEGWWKAEGSLEEGKRKGEDSLRRGEEGCEFAGLMFKALGTLELLGGPLTMCLRSCKR